MDEATSRIMLVDLSEPKAPAVIATFPVDGEGGTQAVGLVADRSNENMFWVLTGLNAHKVGLHLSNLWKDKPDELTSTHAGLVRMELQGETLVPHEQLSLPDGAMPLGLFSEKNGDVLVSAVAYDKENIAKTDFSFSGVANFLKGLRNSLFAGRIYRITPQGTITTEVTSINLLLSMSKLENSPLVFSTYRFSMSYFLPSVRLVLGVDVLRQQGLVVRKMDWKTILPPYRFFPEITLL